MSPAQLFSRRSAAWCVDACAVMPLSLALGWHWLQPLAAQAWREGRGLQAQVDLALATLAGAPVDTAPTALALRAGTLAHTSTLLSLVFCVCWAAVACAWHLPAERSIWQGSLGKHWLGLKVVDAATRKRPGLEQTLLRHLASGISWATLNIGHVMALLPPRYQTLHDAIAQTQVVMSTPPPLPRPRERAPRRP